MPYIYYDIQMSGGHRDKANSQSTRGTMLFGVPSQGTNINTLRGMVEGQANELSLRADEDQCLSNIVLVFQVSDRDTVATSHYA